MSEQSYPVSIRGIKAAGDITKHRFVGYEKMHVSVQGGRARGVSLANALSGQDCDLVERGSAVVESGGVYSAGDPIISDNQGRAVAASTLSAMVDTGATAVTSTAVNGSIITLTGGDLPEHVLGVALEDSGAAGEYHEIDLWR